MNRATRYAIAHHTPNIWIRDLVKGSIGVSFRFARGRRDE
jgi:hypothetical protein